MVNRITTLFEFDDKGGGLKKIRKDVQATDGAVGKFKASVKGAADELRNSPGARAGIFAVAAAGAGKAIAAASDLEESVNAVRVTFGSAADEVLKLSDNAAQGVGMAASEFNGLAVSFAGFADKVAGPGGDVAGVIDNLTTRSADFASVMNLEVSDAATKFQSALAGESEAMRRFGIDVSAAAVETFAYANGIADLGDKLTEAEKVQARYGLLMQETEQWAGDFANTSDSLANQQRTLKAEITDMAARLGDVLLPAATTAANSLGDFMGVLDSMPAAADEFVVGAGAVAVGLATIGTKATATIGLLGLVAGAVQATKEGLKGNESWLDEDVSIFEKPFQAFGKVGRFIGESDEARAAREMVAEFEAAEMAAASFDRTQLRGLTTMSQVRDKVMEVTDSTHAANVVSLEWHKTMGDFTDPANKFTTGVTSADKALLGVAESMAGIEQGAGGMTLAVQSADTAMLNYARDTNSMVDAQEAAAKAAEEHEKALADLFDEVDRNLSTMFDYENALHDLTNSTQDYEQRERELNDQLGNNEITLEEYATELRNLRVDQNNLADDALTLAETFAEQQGAVDGSAESYRLQKEELLRLADQFPLLRDEIQLYIEQLNRIPSVIGTQITIGHSGSSVIRTDGQSQSIGDVSRGGRIAAATGGIVNRPTFALIGEAGPEAVIPLSKSPGNSPLPPMMTGGSGVSIGQLIVQAPAGADADAFAREVVQALRREVRFGGPIPGIAA